MTQRALILIASSLTAFILVVAGGIYASATRVNAASAATAPATAAANPDSTDWQTREAQYQELISQANAQLQAAYEKQQQLEQQLASQAIPTSWYAVSASQAVQIASSAVPGAVAIGTPQLVSFQGIPAYEVHLNIGTVYVNASTGSVLSNSTVVTNNSAPVKPIVVNTNPSRGGDDGHGDGHENGD